MFQIQTCAALLLPSLERKLIFRQIDARGGVESRKNSK